MKLSIIIPAFNEEAYLPATLDAIQLAAARLRDRVDIDLIVVDNNSEDGTASVALERGARVVHEPVQGIAHARNSGAHNAEGDVLVFIDADVIIPPNLLEVIYSAGSESEATNPGQRLLQAATWDSSLRCAPFRMTVCPRHYPVDNIERTFYYSS